LEEATASQVPDLHQWCRRWRLIAREAVSSGLPSSLIASARAVVVASAASATVSKTAADRRPWNRPIPKCWTLEL